jgi:hypothetical protein
LTHITRYCRKLRDEAKPVELRAPTPAVLKLYPALVHCVPRKLLSAVKPAVQDAGDRRWERNGPILPLAPQPASDVIAQELLQAVQALKETVRELRQEVAEMKSQLSKQTERANALEKRLEERFVPPAIPPRAAADNAWLQNDLEFILNQGVPNMNGNLRNHSASSSAALPVPSARGQINHFFKPEAAGAKRSSRSKDPDPAKEDNMTPQPKRLKTQDPRAMEDSSDDDADRLDLSQLGEPAPSHGH